MLKRPFPHRNIWIEPQTETINFGGRQLQRFDFYQHGTSKEPAGKSWSRYLPKHFTRQEVISSLPSPDRTQP